MSGILPMVCSGITVLVKGASFADSILVSKALIEKQGSLTKTEKAAFVANLVFGVAQCLDAAATGTHMVKPGLLSAGLRIGVGASAGALDVTRVTLIKCSRKKWDADDTLDVIGIALYRITDVAAIAIQAKKETLCDSAQLEKIETAVMVVSTASQALTGRKQVTYVCNLIWDNLKDAWVVDPNVVLDPAAEDQQADNGAAAAQGPNADLEDAERDLRAEMDREVQEIISWQTLDKIPRSIAQHFPKCKFTGKPIRYLMEPIFPHADRTLVFSREGIKEWLTNHPRQTPSWWPQREVFSSDSFHEASAFVQYELIDKKLESLARVYQSFQQRGA